ncbi:MAG: UDP-2,3-diacylglucosamine diphosphatase [Deltaproteobacteria bacterium]|nr:UDP-2,3-diacylglucosamine diphosphatase [Deltaproteobacteria bacterium]
MRAIFIADAHLKGLNDPNQKHLCSFLEPLKDIDKLFILGDLFEFWTGHNQVLEHCYAPVLSQFKRLKQNGTEIIYIEGNHDFSVAPFFKEILGGEVYPDSADINLDGKRFFLAHGDIVEHSAGYKIWRSFLRSSIFNLIIKITPPAFVWGVAMCLSKTSRRNHKMGDRLDTRQREFAQDKIREGFDIVILAHSHCPDVSKETVNEKKGVYANPGDWIKEFSYLVYEDGNIRLERHKKIRLSSL